MTINKLKQRIGASPITSGQVARLIVVSETHLSLILAGHRTPPLGFIAKASAALELLKRADKQAEAARANVLSEWPTISKRFK